MADLPEREQADTSFDTLYHLAKKMEVHNSPYSSAKRGTSTMSHTRVIKSIPPREHMWQCSMLTLPT